MNSSCFVICELNGIVFMATVKHFRVKMRLASFCCVNLIKYTMPCEVVFIYILIFNILKLFLTTNISYTLNQNRIKRKKQE